MAIVKKKPVTPPARGYAPGGVTYKPLPPNQRVSGAKVAAPLAAHGVNSPWYAQTNPGVKFYTPPTQGYAPGGVSWKPIVKKKPAPKKKPPRKITQPGVISKPGTGNQGGDAGTPPPDPWLTNMTADINRQIYELQQSAIKSKRDLLVGF